MQFVFEARVSRLSQQPVGVQLAGESGVRAHQAVVVCAGAASAGLVRPLGLKLPVVPLGGYTVSAPLRDPMHAPRCAVVDWERQINLVRLGQRVRAGGGAELGTSARHHTPSLQRLYHALSHWFPGGMQPSQGVHAWRGTRVMTPDGAPILGASGLPGVWLNLGHGNHGAAMAHGAGQLLADLIAGRAPGLDTAGLDPQRF
ncbi:D-amino acid dehydrogenase small subunit [compost metagenome]